MRYTGPKNRLSRREGLDLGLKTPGSKAHASLLKKINVLPGQHGTRKRRKFSERGSQLREKQKLRFMFGISEKQLKKYFKQAIRKKGNTGQFLVEFLERRLDNIVYRLGMTPTRASARQLVNHGHVKVNDRKNTIPSAQIKVNDIITFCKEETAKIPYVEAMLNNKDIILPNWLERKGTVGKVKAIPPKDDIEKQIILREIIEYYSR
jgi:small subunit ribosomal protein S4